MPWANRQRDASHRRDWREEDYRRFVYSDLHGCVKLATPGLCSLLGLIKAVLVVTHRLLSSALKLVLLHLAARLDEPGPFCGWMVDPFLKLIDRWAFAPHQGSSDGWWLMLRASPDVDAIPSDSLAFGVN